MTLVCIQQKVLNAATLNGALFLLLLNAAAPVRADEGFWAFDQVPVQQIESRTGVHLSLQWIRHLQQSTVHFSDSASASVVSADGLLLTNFHVVRPILQKISTQEHDFVRDGFLARKLDQELPLPGVNLDALMSTTDVTEQVRPVGANIGLAADNESARAARVEQIERSATHGPSDVAKVIPLFGGGRYVLYRYKRYTDVRVVFSPELSVVGQPKMVIQWEHYPAPKLDFAFIRAYENGRPARPAEYLSWSYAGPREGSVVFVTGAPTYSHRLGSVAELQFRRDIEFPQGLDVYARLENALGIWTSRNEEQRQAGTELFVQSSYVRRLFAAMLTTTLRDPQFWRRQIAWEKQIREELTTQAHAAQSGVSALAAQALAAYAAIESINNDNGSAEEFARSHVLPNGDVSGVSFWQLNQGALPWDSIWSEDLVGPLYLSSLALLRSHAESRKQDNDRAMGYRDAERPVLRQWLESLAQINSDIETLRLKVWLESLILRLGADDPITIKALNHESPAARATQLAHGTQLSDRGYREKLLDADTAAFDAVRDPMIDLLRELEPDIDRIDDSYTVLAARRKAARETIIRAMANLRRTPVYPNANRTVRLEYGKIEGYALNAQPVPSMTDLRKVYEWSEHQYEFVPESSPYELSSAWRSARAKMNLSAALNFLDSADSLGGNSGSATVDSEGHLVGVVCSIGNIDTEGGSQEFAYDPRERTEAVATPGMIEILKWVYGARELLREISQGHR